MNQATDRKVDFGAAVLILNDNHIRYFVLNSRVSLALIRAYFCAHPKLIAFFLENMAF